MTNTYLQNQSRVCFRALTRENQDDLFAMYMCNAAIILRIDTCIYLCYFPFLSVSSVNQIKKCPTFSVSMKKLQDRENPRWIFARLFKYRRFSTKLF